MKGYGEWKEYTFLSYFSLGWLTASCKVSYTSPASINDRMESTICVYSRISFYFVHLAHGLIFLPNPTIDLYGVSQNSCNSLIKSWFINWKAQWWSFETGPIRNASFKQEKLNQCFFVRLLLYQLPVFF